MAATNFTPIQLYFSTTASAVPTAANLAQGELAINITDGKLYYEDNGGVVQVIATKGAGTIGGSTTQIQYNNAGALAGNAAMVFNNSTNVTTLTTLNLTNALGAIYGGTAQSTYTQGDFLYASASNTLAKLGIGTVNFILTSTGTVPQWVAPSSVTVNTATNLAGGAAGSVPYQSGVATTTFLAIGTANRVMTSTGTAPQWVTALTGLTGVSSSSITNTSLTSGRVVVSSTAGLQADNAALTFDGTTLSAGGFSTVGLSTLVKTVKIGDSNFSGVAVFAAATPAKLYMGTGTVTDVTSAISATNTTGAIASLAITPIAATNTSVTYTNASTLYIAGAPSAGTNITITNPYSLYVAAGAAYFGGAVTFAGSASLAALTVTSLTNTGLTSGRVVFSTTGGLETDSANLTFDGTNLTLLGGTANGVTFLNGSKVLTSGTALTFDGTNFATTGKISSTSGGTSAGIRFGGSDVTTALYDDGAGNTYIDAVFGSNANIPLFLRTKGTGFFSFQPGGTEALRLTSTSLFTASGINVGIGTSSPSQKLTVSGAANFSRFSINSNPIDIVSTAQSFARFQSTGADFYLGTESSTDGGFFPSSTAYAAILYNANATPMQFYTSGGLRATLDSSGNLGLGTSSFASQARFQVAGGRSYFGSNDTVYAVHVAYNNTRAQAGQGYYIGATDSATPSLVLSNTGGVERMRIDFSGNVGIGTNSPTFKLTVANGATSLAANQYLRFGAGIFASSDGSVDNYLFTGSTSLKWRNAADSAELMQLTNAGNLGLGVTPSAGGGGKTLDVLSYSSFAQRTAGNSDLSISWNAYIDSGTAQGGGYKYKITGDVASAYSQNGTHVWYIAPSGTAGNAISFTQAMMLDSSGNLLVGATSFGTVYGAASGVIKQTGGVWTDRGQFSAAGGSTTTFVTLANASNNQSYLVSVRQSGAGLNFVSAFVIAYGTGAVAIRFAQDNTNPVLDMNITNSGLALRLVLATGFGTTTWDWVITRLG